MADAINELQTRTYDIAVADHKTAWALVEQFSENPETVL
jgi:hypothetical protein